MKIDGISLEGLANMRSFIITVDTEGDNLWCWKEGDNITTENVYWLDRFQWLCDQYGFKPVWLSNWEMLQNDDFVAFMKQTMGNEKCELGMHLHAWNTPPITALPRCKNSGAPYLIEYSPKIIEKKIQSITELIRQKFGFTPVSHRAGRWAMNDTYFRLLYKYGYKIDCSYTPGINWKSSRGQTPGFGGSDYRNISYGLQRIGNVVEVPVTVKKTHKMFVPEQKTLRSVMAMGYHALKGNNVWLRPNGNNLSEMLWLIDENSKMNCDYLMFMIHSSELMPGGSPTFPDKNSIEILYRHLQIIFDYISKDYAGCTLEEYCRKKISVETM